MKPYPIVFAHGAGLPSSHPWMVRWAEHLRALGTVTTFDYPYMQRGKRMPDRMPILLEAHRAVLQQQSGPVVLVGKSMGGRVGALLALEETVAAVVCLGFPLVSASGRSRQDVLLSQRQPVMCVQGTRDKMAPLPLLDEVRAKMNVRCDLHVVPTGDHGLNVTKTHTKKTGRTQEDEDADAIQAIGRFLGSLNL